MTIGVDCAQGAGKGLSLSVYSAPSLPLSVSVAAYVLIHLVIWRLVGDHSKPTHLSNLRALIIIIKIISRDTGPCRAYE